MTRPTHAILIAILAVLLIGVALVAIPHLGQAPETEPAPAPTNQAEQQTFEDAAQGFTFQYPGVLSTTYIRATDWPPKLTVGTTSPVCMNKQDERGRTTARNIGGQAFCVTELSEGAAGSMYTTYTYVTKKDDKHLTLEFTLRATQCANYTQPERTACTSERETFRVDDLAKKIIDSVAFK